MVAIKSGDSGNEEMRHVILFQQAEAGDTAYPDGIPNEAEDYRMLIEAIFPSKGVVRNGMKVTAKSPADSTLVVVQSGIAILDSGYSGGGRFLAKLQSDKEISVPAAPGSGTRIHRVVAYALDKADMGDEDYGWALEVLPDTGSGTPPEEDYMTTLALITRTSGVTTIADSAIEDERAGSWQTLSAPTGYTYSNVQYRRVGYDVELRGNMTRTIHGGLVNQSGSIGAGDGAKTLPSSIRPPFTMAFAVTSGSEDGEIVLIRASINTIGELYFTYDSDLTGTAKPNVAYLDGIRYSLL